MYSSKKQSEHISFFCLWKIISLCLLSWVLFLVQRIYTAAVNFLHRVRFKQICYVIQIACRWSVLPVTMLTWHKTYCTQILQGEINCLSVYAALRSDKAAWRITCHTLIAVTKQTAVHSKLSRLQLHIKYSVGHHKKILVRHFISLHTYRSLRRMHLLYQLFCFCQ